MSAIVDEHSEESNIAKTPCQFTEHPRGARTALTPPGCAQRSPGVYRETKLELKRYRAPRGCLIRV